MTYCEVIVDIAHEQVDHVFTYRVPEGMGLSPGTRVLVPFGPRKVEGYVLSLSRETELSPGRIREVLKPLEDYPILLPALIDLAHWLRSQAHCTLAQALRLMFPAQMRDNRVQVKTRKTYRLGIAPGAVPEALAQLSRAKTRQKLLSFVAERGQVPAEELRAAFPSGAASLRALCEQGYLQAEEAEAYRRPYDAIAPEPVASPTLTPHQQAAMEQALPALAAGTGAFLLHGVTGSGKTEIYIQLVHRALAQGRRAIVLVPEIALTPQMVDWFRGRFGGDMAVLHSRLSAGERYDEWRRVREGGARVVIGARSAVFAPVSNLGLIIIDEEHEQSYLSEHTPQYDTREVARRRCETEGATLLLASATPSMRSFAMALRGDLELLELPERVLGRSLPTVHLVDMRRELAAGNQSVLSNDLMEALKDCLRRGEQAMLLLNRRGYSTFVSCRSCGHVVQCPNCDISLTYHQDGEALRCHYCGHTTAPPQTCPACGSAHIRYFGAGTQKVEEAVRKFFPRARLLRMDVDTTRAKDAHATLLQQFRDREADILIGTQMIAKGLDFPEVTLVGVIAADSMLHLPDYRAAERTFQLVTQVAGRAGRADKPGEVFVQTYDPEHYAIQCAMRQDYRAFYETEMLRRRRQLYPPFTMLARLLAEGREQQQVRNTVEQARVWLTQWLEDKPEQRKVTVSLRASEAPVQRLRGKERAMLFLRLIDTQPAQRLLEALSEYAAMPEQGVALTLEMNPATMI